MLIARIAQRTESTGFDRLRVWDAVLRETRMLPGVVSVSLASHAPIQNAGDNFPLRVPDRPGFEVRTLGWGVSQNYFDALGIPIVRGVGVYDVRELALAPWKRMGGRGTFLELDGTGGLKGMYVLELPVGGATNPERHLYEERG